MIAGCSELRGVSYASIPGPGQATDAQASVLTSHRVRCQCLGMPSCSPFLITPKAIIEAETQALKKTSASSKEHFGIVLGVGMG